MSPEDKDEVKAEALFRYMESLQEATMLRDKITESGNFYVEAGEQLKTDPFTYLSKQYDFAPQADVEKLIRNWMDASNETERLKQKAISYGVSL